MSETPHKPRPITLRTLWGVLFPGNRDSDSRVRRYGLTAIVVTTLLTMVQQTLQSEREDRRADRLEARTDMRAQTDAITTAMAAVATRLESLDARATQLQEASATVQGMVLGRLKCPECPKCPGCPPCPTVTVLPAPSPPSPNAKPGSPRPW